MKTRWFGLIALIIILAGGFASPAQADGIIIPEPPICYPIGCPPPPGPHPIMAQLAIRYHHVTVTIDNQVAVTHVDQVFTNPNDYAVEGTYLFPLPQDAAMANFTLWVDGQPVKGEVLSADQARQQYEEIVRSQRDPALLEYAGRGAVRARIFPILPQGERRIELEYSQVLTADNGLVRYIYPLNTEKFSRKLLESVSVSVDIRTKESIRAVYSPSHTLDIQRKDQNHVTAGYEANNVLPDTDFSLYYSVGESAAFHLLTFRSPADPEDPDGFFLLLLAPKPETSSQPMPKDIFLVLDHSGSMEGEKFRQVQAAVQFILTHLNVQDRFNIVAFSSAVETYADGLRPASEAPQAQHWAEQLSAKGSTDINRALLEAASMADKERPTYVIFLTDGLPTAGETDSQKIINNMADAPANLRLFAFGVGYDVDTYLLNSLTAAHHGASVYVQQGVALDEVVSSFYARISTPVLTDLTLDFGGLAVYDLYPQPLPDLFLGSQVLEVGRYKDGGKFNVTLSGQVDGQTQTFRYDAQVFTTDSRGNSQALASLPRLWATRKVGYLLNQVRLNGADPETIDQIVTLSIRYGIVTPYTSYLVTEPQALGAAAQQQIANDTYNQIQSQAPAAPSGKTAVDRAAGEGGMVNAEAPAAAPAELAGQIRVVGAHTFLFTNNTWTDTRFDPQTMTTVKVAFLSPDYFALEAANPDLASALALGQSVIAGMDGVFYEVVSEGSVVPPLRPVPGPSPVPVNEDTPNPVPTPTSGAAPLATVTPTAPSTATTSPKSSSTPLPGLTPTAQPATQSPSPTCLGFLVPLGFAALAWCCIRFKLRRD